MVRLGLEQPEVAGGHIGSGPRIVLPNHVNKEATRFDLQPSVYVNLSGDSRRQVRHLAPVYVIDRFVQP